MLQIAVTERVDFGPIWGDFEVVVRGLVPNGE